MSDDRHKPLKNIIQQIKDYQIANKKSLVVFDLDSTLFDVSPRLEQILLDFAMDFENQKKYPDSCKVLKNIKMHRSDWGIKGALIRAGLDQHHPDFHHAVREFWMKNFFSNHYLKFDKPYDGAVDFVQKVAAIGAQIVYLTGRDQPNMEVGSTETLLKHKFPLDNYKSKLVLKPQKGMDDAEFKKDWFLALPENYYEKIWFFENEPLNVNLIRKHHPEVEIIFFESTHAGKAHPPEDIPKIIHYIMEEE